MDFLNPITDDQYSEVLQWFRDYVKAHGKEKSGAKLAARVYAKASRMTTNFLNRERTGDIYFVSV